MTFAPLNCRWTGDAFVPIGRHAGEATQRCVIGQIYRLSEVSERSDATHNHYFAVVKEAWQNLPESMAERFDSPEKLRKYALIKCGYADQRQIVCASKAEAQRLAAFIRPMDEYAIVLAQEAVVTVFTAQSQSYRAMGKAEFAESKNKVLDYVAALVGVQPAELEQNAGRAA